MRLLLRFLGFLFAAGTIVGVSAAAVVGYFVWDYSRDLPDYQTLADYEPPVTTRLHAADGRLIAEYAREQRLFLPIQAVPQRVIHAFLSAEDKNFYSHGGIDFVSILRAVVVNLENRGRNVRPQGASTITQQVAKNFLLTNETTIERKVQEALLALRIEQAYSKDQILELYLNEIYFGLGAYGIAAAALTYFDKMVQELTIEEAAYLASLPKAPNNYHPFRHTQRALERRNWVIDRMAENTFITLDEARTAQARPLEVTGRDAGAQIFAAEYFAEDVRRTLIARYGEKGLYEGGLSVRTSLDPQLQEIARRTLTDGLVRFDEARGWRGPVAQVEIADDWGRAVAEVEALTDIAPWRLAVVLEAGASEATIGLQPGRERSGALSAERVTAVIPLEGMRWARPTTGPRRGQQPGATSHVLARGDVVYVEPLDTDAEGTGRFRLRQVPEVSGGLVAMDPHTGRVRAVVGGFSYDQSEFNRATQAQRQPGSAFKPFIYATAIDNGYTPSSIVVDAAVEISQGPGLPTWRPTNYSNKVYGPQTLRFGIERSRNLMTVRLSRDVGMPMIAHYANKFGVYDNLQPYLSMALGAGETTVMRMTGGYAMFANGGKKITPSLIDRIQDRYGRTIYRHDERECPSCNADTYKSGQQPPQLIDRREQVIDPLTAYQMTSIMEGVVQRGTATIIREVGKPLAGKTGTTNDYKDAWFVGYSPDLAVGVYIGYDRPRNMGRSATGGQVAAPVFRDFMAAALKDQPATPFRVPPGLKLVRVSLVSGQRAGEGEGRTIMEAFKPGTGPTDSYALVDYEGADFGSTPSAGASGSVGSGTGGLY